MLSLKEKLPADKIKKGPAQPQVVRQVWSIWSVRYLKVSFWGFVTLKMERPDLGIRMY